MSSHTLAVAGYVALLVALVSLVVVSHRSDAGIATGGRVLMAIRRRRAGRLVLVCAWWWLGWHLFVR